MLPDDETGILAERRDDGAVFMIGRLLYKDD